MDQYKAPMLTNGHQPDSNTSHRNGHSNASHEPTTNTAASHLSINVSKTHQQPQRQQEADHAYETYEDEEDEYDDDHEDTNADDAAHLGLASHISARFHVQLASLTSLVLIILTDMCTQFAIFIAFIMQTDTWTLTLQSQFINHAFTTDVLDLILLAILRSMLMWS